LNIVSSIFSLGWWNWQNDSSRRDPGKEESEPEFNKGEPRRKSFSSNEFLIQNRKRSTSRRIAGCLEEKPWFFLLETKQSSKSLFCMLGWWNWQTHQLEGLAPVKGMGVQIPLSAFFLIKLDLKGDPTPTICESCGA
jgi:hypothetical protein